MGEVEVMGRAKGKGIGNLELGIRKDVSKRKKFVRSVEYEVLSNLILQNYVVDGHVDFERLLSIPMESRIPGLMKEFGLRRVYQMIELILREYCYGSGLPKSKVLTETRMKVCACDVVLMAEEFQLALEDLIVLFEAKRQRLKREKEVTHESIMRSMEEYGRERLAAYAVLKEKEGKETKEGELGRGNLELGIGDWELGKEGDDKVKRMGEVRSIGSIIKDEYGGFEPAA